MTLVAVADMFGISGRRHELEAILADAERAAIGQPGCLRYSFAQALAEPDRFVLLSEWRDQATLDAHYASPEFARFQMSLNGMLARPSEMTVYSATEAARPLPSGPLDPRDAD
jgi:quinol monooxygenase YgiN